MENFIVSARKYRPQTFDTVVGQFSITNTLKNAIKNRSLAQAFLFCGPRGVGKTTCARILAKTINCQNISENYEACNTCDSCQSFNSSSSFNIHELDAASNNSVEDIRNLVDQVRIPPQLGNYKIYIIDEVHMLSPNAFNAFLKTLEEPPAYAKFILATTEKHKIIPTILSRCQIYDFKRITVEDIASHLEFVAKKENVTAETDALHIIAQKADGALRDALTIFDQIVSFGGKNITYKNVIENLNVLDYDYYFKIVDAILAGDIKKVLLMINEIIDNGFDGQHFIVGFGEHLRNLLVGKDTETLKLLEVGGSIKGKYLEQARICSPSFLINALEINNKCDVDYKSSNNKNLHLELALMKMCTLSSGNQNIQTQSPKVIEKPKGNYKPTTPKPIAPTVKEPLPIKNEIKKPQVSTKKPLVNPSFPSTTSIKKAKNAAQLEAEKKEAEEDLSNKPFDSFTQEQLQKAWESVSANYKADQNLLTTLSKHKPELKENFIVDFTVDNKVQEEEIKERLLEFLPKIRQELNNYRIQLNIKVVPQTSINKPYTSKEKFNKMAEKNPSLIKLKDQLNLEIDY